MVDIVVNLGLVDILLELMVRQEFYSSGSAEGYIYFTKRKISYFIHDILGRLCHRN